jgi:tetratricopeptide (TPR) repeat protein
MQFKKILEKMIFCCVIALISYSPVSSAFDVVITEREFRMLHENCKRFYSVSQVGRSLDFTTKFTPDEFRVASTDAEAAGGAWHYCAGLVYISRATTQSSDVKKQEIYRRALAEISFSAGKVHQDHRLYGEIHLNKARVLYLLNEKSTSMQMLQKLLVKLPSYTPIKIEISNQYAKSKRLQEAVDILLSVDARSIEKSADVNYALGLYLFKLGKIDESYVYAKQAYKLKYPLPWLRNQLIKKGYKF